MLNYLKATELKRDELIRLVESYETQGVSETCNSVNGEETSLKQIENGWTAQKGTELKVLRRTKAGWRLYSRSLEDLPDEGEISQAA